MNQKQEYISNNSENLTQRLFFLANILLNSTDNPLNSTLLNDSLANPEMIKPSGLSEDQKNILRLMSKILCSFSIAGLLFVLFMYIFFRSVRSFVLELAVWLCATNLFFNINVYFPIQETNNNGWCLSQGLISTFSDLSSMIWTTIIGFFSYFSVVKSGFIDKNKRNLRLCFILIAYFIPGIFTLL